MNIAPVHPISEACVHAGTNIIINRLKKTCQATNKEFYVVRVLPKEAADLSFLYLVCIHPLSCILCRTCFQMDINTLLLFFSANNPRSPWKTRLITKLLKENTTRAVYIAIDVRDYRQLTIAITENSFSRSANRSTSTTIELRKLILTLLLCGKVHIDRSKEDLATA